MLNEFKKFVMRGNVLDLAVGIIIGGAFGRIIASLVGDLLMPLIGIIAGGVNFSELSVTVPAAIQGREPVILAYGNFIQTVIDFLFVALGVFMIVKLVNSMQKKPADAPPPPPPGPSREEVLLTEIRDAIKSQKA